MAQEDPKVRLPNDIARCRPTGQCGMESHCARRLAPMGVRSPVADFNTLNIVAFGCSSYLKASDFKGKAEDVRPVHKHWSTAE
jgi:hypothetical protein